MASHIESHKEPPSSTDFLKRSIEWWIVLLCVFQIGATWEPLFINGCQFCGLPIANFTAFVTATSIITIFTIAKILLRGKRTSRVTQSIQKIVVIRRNKKKVFLHLNFRWQSDNSASSTNFFKIKTNPKLKYLCIIKTLYKIHWIPNTWLTVETLNRINAPSFPLK